MINQKGFLRTPFKPGTLWDHVQECATNARARGVLSLQTLSCTMLEQNGIRFPVCISTNHGGSPVSTAAIDPELYIADLTTSHVCLLGQEGINDHQLVIKRMTAGGRDKVLDRDDLEAIAVCLKEMDCLVYFDSLTDGRSGQKRMKLIPLPLTPELPELPLEPIVRDAVYHGPVGSSPVLPFLHAILRMPETLTRSSRLNVLELGYELVLRYLGLRDMVGNLIGDYDLLVNRRWLMVAPRSRSSYESVALDALAYTGMFCVKDQREADLMQSTGPLSVLRYLGRS